MPVSLAGVSSIRDQMTFCIWLRNSFPLLATATRHDTIQLNQNLVWGKQKSESNCTNSEYYSKKKRCNSVTVGGSPRFYWTKKNKV